MRSRSLLPLVAPGLIARLCAAPGPVAAAIDARSEPIVERYVEATGGRAALEAERGIHSLGRIESLQLSGTIEQWTQVPDRLVVGIRLGTLRLITGKEGRSGGET